MTHLAKKMLGLPPKGHEAASEIPKETSFRLLRKVQTVDKTGFRPLTECNRYLILTNSKPNSESTELGNSKSPNSPSISSQRPELAPVQNSSLPRFSPTNCYNVMYQPPGFGVKPRTVEELYLHCGVIAHAEFFSNDTDNVNALNETWTSANPLSATYIDGLAHRWALDFSKPNLKYLTDFDV